MIGRAAAAAPVLLAVTLALTLVPAAAGDAAPAPTGAGTGWLRVDTPNLTLFSDATGEEALAVGRNLERFRGLLAALATNLHVHSPLPTTVYAFRDEASFRPYKPGRMAAADQPLVVAGFFVKHRDGNYIGLNANPQADPWPIVYHEYVHYFLNNNFRDIPLWFGEGMAECFSSVRFREGAVVIGRPLPRHVRWLRDHPLIPLPELFAIDAGSRDYNEGVRQGTFYAESWALVHYLLWGRPGAEAGGLGFLRDLERDAGLAEALRPLLGPDPGDLQTRLAAYVKTRLPRGEVEIDLPLSGIDARARPIGRDEALYRLGDFLLHVDPARLASAEVHLREALRLNPAHGPAHAGLAQVRAQQRRYDEAFAGFETALRIDPADDRAALLYAYALLEKTFPEGLTRHALTDRPPEPVLRARDMFRRNTRANPGIGEAWAGLGLTYLLASRDVGEGIEALEKARRLLPAREDVALNLATLYARSGARDRARALVDTVLSRSADPTVRAGGSEVLFRGNLEEAAALLEAGQADEALRRLRALREATADPGLRGEVDAHLRTLETTMETNRHIALFNTAVERANRQDYAGAVPLLEQVVSQAADPALRTEAQTLLSRLRQTLLFNRAVQTANAGDPRGAAALLRKLLRETVDPEIERRARALLRELEHPGRAAPR